MSGTAYPRMRVPSAAALVAAAAVAGVLVLLYVIRDSLPVFVVALILAFLMDPVVTWLAARRVPRWVATLLVMALTLLGVAVAAGIFLETVIEQATAFIAVLPGAFRQLTAWVETASIPPSVAQGILSILDQVATWAAGIDVTVILAPIVDGLIGILGAFFTLLVLPFFLFYVIAGRPALAASMRTTVPRQWLEDVDTVLGIVLDSFGTYVRAEAVVAAALGIMTFVGLMGLSVAVDPRFAEFALLLSIIAAFSELIPNFGPWIAAIPAVLFTLTISPSAVAAVIVLYIVLMFVEGQILVPKVHGDAFSFHPALVLFIVVAGVALMGILGAIIALPVTAAAWRTVRYAFRRSTGEPPGWATATRGEAGASAVRPGTSRVPASPAADAPASPAADAAEHPPAGVPVEAPAEATA